MIPRPRLSLLYGAAGAGALAAWWWWRVLLPADAEALTILNYDLYAEVVPRLEFAYRALRQGHIPLWNPYQLSGTPFLATQQHGVLYPLNLAHLLLPLPLALSVTAVLHYWIAAVSTAVLARDLGASRSAALLSAIGFTLSGAMFLRLYLPPHLYAASWLPAQLLLAHRMYDSGVTVPRIVALAAVCGLQILGGYAQYSVFAAYVLVAWLFWKLLTGRAGPTGRAAAALVAAAALALLLAAAQLLPTAELLLESPRRPGLLDDSNMRGQDFRAIVRVLLLPSPLPGVPGEASIGLLVLFLAVIGATAGRSLRERGFLVLGIALALPLAQGVEGPLYPWLRSLPAYGWFREPHRILVVVTLLTSLLAAAGLDSLARATTRREVVRRSVPALVVLAALAGFLLQAQPSLLTPAPWRRALWVAGALVAAACVSRGSWRAFAVAALAVAELVSLHRNPVALPHTDPRLFEASPEAVRFLREHQGTARTLVAEGLYRAFQFQVQPLPKTGMMAGLYAIGDYENLYSRRYALYLGALQRRGPLPRAWQGRVFGNAATLNRRLLDLTGCCFVLASPVQPFVRPGAPEYPLLHRDPSASVLSNPTALPRAYLVHRAVPVDGVEEALRKLRNPLFPYRTAITIEGIDGGPVELPAAPGSVAIEAYEPERVVLRVGAESEAFVVLSDQYYPGWTARLDGESVPIHRANGVFRTVRVPAGQHRLEFVYAPLSFRLGAAISAAALLGCGLALARARRSRRAPKSPQCGAPRSA